MRLRKLQKTTGPNDGTRSLVESTLLIPVVAAVSAWSRHATGVLIGRLAVSFYAVPLVTQNVDFLFAADAALPADVPGFRRNEPRVFVHEATAVAVRLFTPSMLNVPAEIAAAAMQSTVWSSRIEIASPSSLVVLALFRLTHQDQASETAQRLARDITALIKTGEVDVLGFGLSQDKLDQYRSLVKMAEQES